MTWYWFSIGPAYPGFKPLPIIMLLTFNNPWIITSEPNFLLFWTGTNEMHHDDSGQPQLLYNDRGPETKGFV